MDELDDLPLKVRIKRYLDLAADARKEAQQSNGVARAAYLRIAEQWDLLAADAAEKLDRQK